MINRIDKKHLYIIIGAVVVIVAAVLIYQFVARPAIDNRTVEVTATERIENTELGFGFTYPSGIDQLTMIEPPLEEGPLLDAYILMNTQSWLASQQAEDAATPPSITILVFSKPEPAVGAPELSRIEELKAWATENQTITGITVSETEPEIVEIDGVKALKYSADSSYQQDYHLMSYQNNIYVFVGQHEADDDFMHTAYKNLINTISFL